MVESQASQVEEPMAKIDALDYVWRIYFAVWAINIGITMGPGSIGSLVTILSLVAMLGLLPVFQWKNSLSRRLMTLLAVFVLVIGLVAVSFPGDVGQATHFSLVEVVWPQNLIWGAFPLLMLPMLRKKLDPRALEKKLSLLSGMSIFGMIILVVTGIFGFLFAVPPMIFIASGLTITVQSLSGTRITGVTCSIFYVSGTITSLLGLLTFGWV